MAQIVYYFYAGIALGSPAKSMAFSVPTGNFGDIFAGYVAHKMGLPIHQLIVATNSNDILHRFFSANHYDRMDLVQTHSPSMDIQVSSNFERLLFDYHGKNGKAITGLMDAFRQTGTLSIDEAMLTSIRQLFSSLAVSDHETVEMISTIYKETGELLDPHTAIGVAAARQAVRQKNLPIITLSTAHPIKFAAAIEAAKLPLPELAIISSLMDKPERFEILPNDIANVKNYIGKLTQ